MIHGLVKTLLVALLGLTSLGAVTAEEKARVIVLTDIANEPDDEESLVRFLVYSNEFDVEGLVATTSTWLKTGLREDLIRRQIDAYGEVRENLTKHAAGYPTPAQLSAVVRSGHREYGMAAVGAGKGSPGSRLIVEVLDEKDPRPVWITVWGGANTLAQALRDLRAGRSATAVASAVAKLRVYSISDQDDAGAWIRKEFPDLFYVVSPSTQGWHDYWRATWTGISGDRHYKNGPGYRFDLVDNPWLEEHVIRNHGPLGALYPKLAYIMEGDTPSFLGLVRNGLGWSMSPAYGGWGGRYVLYQGYGDTRPIWTNSMESRDTVVLENGQAHTSDPATIWRWREHFQHDFAARMDWCVADAFAKANHNPRPALNGDTRGDVLTIRARGETEVSLTAEGTNDPDSDPVRVRWWIYPEASSLKGASLSSADGLRTIVRLPAVKAPSTLHVILEAVDDGQPPLYAYRRAVLEVSP